MQFQELVYLMEVVKLEKGSYLFKPGDLSNSIYLVADGLLELSITFNDKHMHMLKRHSKMQNIEQSPRIPKKKNNLEEFFKYNFKLVNCHSIKPKAEIIPVFNDTGVVGAV